VDHVEGTVEQGENECVAMENVRHARDRANGGGSDGEVLSLEEERACAGPGGLGTRPRPEVYEAGFSIHKDGLENVRQDKRERERWYVSSRGLYPR